MHNGKDGFAFALSKHRATLQVNILKLATSIQSLLLTKYHIGSTASQIFSFTIPN